MMTIKDIYAKAVDLRGTGIIRIFEALLEIMNIDREKAYRSLTESALKEAAENNTTIKRQMQECLYYRCSKFDWFSEIEEQLQKSQRLERMMPKTRKKLNQRMSYSRDEIKSIAPDEEIADAICAELADAGRLI